MGVSFRMAGVAGVPSLRETHSAESTSSIVSRSNPMRRERKESTSTTHGSRQRTIALSSQLGSSVASALCSSDVQRE